MERIISVPHSGTRTLKQFLGFEQHFHFRDHKVLRQTDLVHIPIRNPWDVAETWACRTRAGGDPRHLVTSYEGMFRFLDSDCPRKLYRIEDFERVEGLGERDLPPDRVDEFQGHMRERVLEPHFDFFSEFYPDLKR